MQEIPEMEDYVFTPTGPLGGLILCGQVEGRFSKVYPDLESALKDVSDRMDSEQFWSNMWRQSDHGNLWMIDREGNEIRP